MGQNNFKKDLVIAEKNQLAVANKYKELGLIDDFEMSPNEYFPYYDATFIKDGKEETVEFKEDFFHEVSGNLFIEFCRIYFTTPKTGSLSDLSISTSLKHIFTIHFKDSIEIYEIPTIELKNICLNKLKVVPTNDKNQPFKSVGYLLKFAEYKNNFKYISNI